MHSLIKSAKEFQRAFPLTAKGMGCHSTRPIWASALCSKGTLPILVVVRIDVEFHATVYPSGAAFLTCV